MIRLLDVFFSLILASFSLPIFVVSSIVIVIQGHGLIFYQKRVGRDERIFQMLKLRTMPKNTASVPTHSHEELALLRFGSLIRELKLDEIPQLVNVIRGEMSLVGFRPCLPEQKNLIRLRRESGVFRLKPGLTGLAQVSGVTMESEVELVHLDKKMAEQFTLKLYLGLVFKTLVLLTGKCWAVMRG